MRKIRNSAMAICFIVLLFAVCGCGKTGMTTKEYVVNVPYTQVSGNEWQANNHTYAYKVELTGTAPNSDKHVGFVILSNRQDVTFEEAFNASGVSSTLSDYFDVEDTVIVEMYFDY